MFWKIKVDMIFLTYKTYMAQDKLFMTRKTFLQTDKGNDKQRAASSPLGNLISYFNIELNCFCRAMLSQIN